MTELEEEVLSPPSSFNPLPLQFQPISIIIIYPIYPILAGRLSRKSGM